MPAYFPFQWHITDACDQRCKHCYIYAEGAPSQVAIPYEVAERVVTQMLHGAVHACRRMASPVGDLSTETLADVYFGDRLAEYRRIDLFEKCAGCPLHGWCRGCPAVAFGYTGDRHAPDPQCWYGLS